MTERIGPAASAAQAGWHEYPPDHPPRLDVVDPATWDADGPAGPDGRATGSGPRCCTPTWPASAPARCSTIGDTDLMLACVQAYNDFLAEYASADPSRFIPIMALPMWDMELCRAGDRPRASGSATRASS